MFNKMLITVVLGVFSIACPANADKVGEEFTKGGYKLVWADEFNKDGAPNPKNWVFEKGFVRNHEAQWYQTDNAKCKNGKLHITAREDIKRNPNYVKGSGDWKETKFIEYTSSSLMTKGLHSWTMGRFVMKAKLAHGQGMWPAFWTVGDKGEWPSSGEIDIMEYYREMILANVASGTGKRWSPKWSGKKVKVKDLGGDEWLNEYHIWRMDWDTKSIRLYVDDRLLNETRLADTYNANPAWGPKNPFHHPQYIIINLALGGDNGGDMEKAELPAEYIIDYVRVYQRDEDRKFKAADDYVASEPYKGKKVGIHHFSEYPKSVNKKCGWDAGSDSQSYAWKPQGRSKESAAMIADFKDKLEGQLSYKFVLNHGWSRWVVEMNPKYGSGTADISKFKKMGFAVKSKDAAGWDSFKVFIADSNDKSYEASLASLGFKPDGKWHRCTIDLNDVKKSGVDPAKIKVLFSVGWGGGVSNGHYFKIDDLYLE
ncbi:MAG: glycoside hydrolase family 16 protein [Phycisphaerae bacterium]|nr:glycoside hydrolase family 16 protein [Phycisphaerae bacterium]